MYKKRRFWQINMEFVIVVCSIFRGKRLFKCLIQATLNMINESSIAQLILNIANSNNTIGEARITGIPTYVIDRRELQVAHHY